MRKALGSAATDPTDEEREIIRRIFDYDERGTPPQMFDDVMENPVSQHTDPDQGG
ncbi:MAG: hypothetical protein P8I99_14520 [Acidimicrobiales bacterium]|nr:hypothetical protein [Acidimicrobiales bacterium]MDG1878619.1 hypothetical protein [Acidimicrobiales bacterium]